MREKADWIYYQKNRHMILNRARDYYENDKKRLRQQARDKYRNLSEEEKNKRRKYGKIRYRWKDVWRKEAKIKRISKKISRGKKSLNIIIITINKKVF